MQAYHNKQEEKKGSNKTLFIIIGSVGVALLVIFSIVGAFFIFGQNDSDSEDEKPDTAEKSEDNTEPEVVSYEFDKFDLGFSLDNNWTVQVTNAPEEALRGVERQEFNEYEDVEGLSESERLEIKKDITNIFILNKKETSDENLANYMEYLNASLTFDGEPSINPVFFGGSLSDFEGVQKSEYWAERNTDGDEFVLKGITYSTLDLSSEFTISSGSREYEGIQYEGEKYIVIGYIDDASVEINNDTEDNFGNLDSVADGRDERYKKELDDIEKVLKEVFKS